MALVKTYLLAPNLDFLPGGPIALGNIIADPLKPHRALALANPGSDERSEQEIVSVIDHDFKKSRHDGWQMNGGVWLKFISLVGGGLKLESNTDATLKYSMDRIETLYYKFEPTEEEIANRIKAPRVQNVLRSGILKSQPVYIITGLKIAKGLKVSTHHSSSRGADAHLTGTVNPQVSVGAGAGISDQNNEKEKFRAEGDRIFAYQLMMIVEKGWKNKIVKLKDYAPKDAFLSRDSDDSEEEESRKIEVETLGFQITDLENVGAEDVSFSQTEVGDGNDKSVYISYTAM